DVACRFQALPHLGNSGLVARLGRADEVVVRDPDAPPRLLELFGDAVAVGLWIDALLARDPFDLLAVLVEAGQEEDVLLAVARAVIARQRVVDDGRIERPEVRDRVDVIDRRGDVEAGHRGWRILVRRWRLCTCRPPVARRPGVPGT